MRYIVLLIAVLTLIPSLAKSQHSEQMVIGDDTISYRYHADPLPSKTKGLGQLLDRYLTFDPNGPKRAHFSVIGGPAYSPNSGWRLALASNLQYRTVATKSTQTPDRLSLRVTASLKRYYGAELDGVNHLGKGRILRYGADLRSEPREFYGLDFASSSSGNRGLYTEKRYRTWIRYSRHINNLLLGTYVDYHYESATNYDSYAGSLLYSEIERYSGAGLGLSIGLRAARSEAINRTRGVNFTVEGIVRPAIVSNYDKTLWQVNIVLDYYQPLWRGALMVLDIYGEYHSKNTPWMLRAEIGSDSRMRGYYPGRYNGNIVVSGQLELRQHIVSDFVAVAWGGCGTALNRFDDFDTSRLLPNYGLGVRYHIATHSSIRLDVGFGRDGCYNFILGYNGDF